MLGDDVVVLSGLVVGESVAASGSFKLRDGVLLNVVTETTPADSRKTGGG
jgi:membrane fusion protein (multidrug efflux system)